MRSTKYDFVSGGKPEDTVEAEQTEAGAPAETKAPAEPEKKEPERSFLQKYWWALAVLLAIAAVFFFKKFQIIKKVIPVAVPV